MRPSTGGLQGTKVSVGQAPLNIKGLSGSVKGRERAQSPQLQRWQRVGQVPKLTLHPQVVMGNGTPHRPSCKESQPHEALRLHAAPPPTP